MDITKHEPAPQLSSVTAWPSRGHPVLRVMGAVPRTAPYPAASPCCWADTGDAPGQHMYLTGNTRALTVEHREISFSVVFLITTLQLTFASHAEAAHAT